MGIVIVLAPLRICSVIGRRQEKLCRLWLFFWSLLAVVAYGAIAYLLNVPEIKQIIDPLSRIFKKLKR